MQNNRACGTKYEEMAASFLEEKGYQILEKNFRCKMGEIDIISQNDKFLCFVEVKFRKDNSKGDPKEAVNFKKQRVICRVADYFLMKHGLKSGQSVRFDVIAISGESLEFVENAFEYMA